MTTNSCGSALPTFDFPQTVAKATRAAPKRLPVAARIVPLVAAAGLAYYANSVVTSKREAIPSDDATMFKALQDAYGDRSSLENLEAASRAYGAGSAAKHPPA